MRVTKTDGGLAVRIPADVVRALGLKEGDEVDLHRSDAGRAAVRNLSHEEGIDTLNRLTRPLPEGYKFDREEANAR